MTFKEWLEQSGMTMCTFAKIADISRNTVKNLIDGRKIAPKTLNRLLLVTKKMRVPITREMFQ